MLFKVERRLHFSGTVDCRVAPAAMQQVRVIGEKFRSSNKVLKENIAVTTSALGTYYSDMYNIYRHRHMDNYVLIEVEIVDRIWTCC